MGNADAARLELGVRHRTRAWQNIDIDLGPGRQGSGDFVEPVIHGLAETSQRVLPPTERISIEFCEAECSGQVLPLG